MSTLNATVLTLLDHAKRRGPNSRIAKIVELLAQHNEVLSDMHFKEGNLPTGHLTTVRTGLPTVAWRLMNAGITPSKSTTAQITEGIGMLEGWLEVDRDLAKLNGDVAAFRLSEARAFVEAMNIEMAQTLFYGNSGTAPEEFTGLSARYSAISGATNGSNVISASGAQSDNSSIWLVVWGDQTVHGIYPKGSEAGLVHEDLGQQVAELTAGVGGTRMMVYRDHWQWKCGIALVDWRFVVRIANIDIGNLVAKSSNADIIELMIKAIHRIPALGMGRPVFYMNRTVFQMLDIYRRDDVISGGGLTYSDVDGKITPTFRGIPIKKTDALLETEAVVS